VQQDLFATRKIKETYLQRDVTARLVHVVTLQRELTAQQSIAPVLRQLPCKLQGEQTSQTRFIAAQQRA
jgi:hypothetical protein